MKGSSLITLVIAGLIAAGVGWYWMNLPSVRPTQEAPSPVPVNLNPKLAIDLYPLYSGDGITWDSAKPESVTIGTTTYMGAGAISATLDGGMDPGNISVPFEEYYSELLLSRGWHLDYDLAAGGHTGGQDGYRNGNGVILVRYFFDYLNNPPNAPSECPCTVTFSLFSNVQN